MKKFIIGLPILLVTLFNFLEVNAFSSQDNLSVVQGSYHKWGQIAIQKTKEKYPQAKITDYFHIGKVSITDYSIEKFRLWLKDSNKEFGVYVNLKIDNKTGQLIEISFKETDR